MKTNERTNRVNINPKIQAGWFVGFLDGDGYLCHTKTKNYIKWELTFNLSFRDKPLLELLKNQFNVGNVSEIKSAKTSTYRYRISSKKSISEIIQPLIKEVPLLTMHRHWQFIRADLINKNNILKFENIPKIDVNVPIPGLTVETILNGENFHNWLVGFIEAELAFTLGNNRAGWSLTQSNAPIFMEAIKKYLGVTTSIYPDLRDNTNLIIREESVTGVQRMIDFLNTPNCAILLGYKKLQYNNWCNELSKMPRYKNVKFTV